MDEYFDIVDETDHVVGRALRSEVHARGELHRAVSVLIFRTDGALLIQRRALVKDEHPGRWSPSASGHVSSGDDYDETASRELEEEVGITTPLQALHRFSASEMTANEFTALYLGGWDGPVTPDPAEVSEVRWIQPGELGRWMSSRPEDFTPTFRTVFSWWLQEKW